MPDAKLLLATLLFMLFAGIAYLTADLCGWLPEDDAVGGWFPVRETNGYVVERLDGTTRERTVRRP